MSDKQLLNLRRDTNDGAGMRQLAEQVRVLRDRTLTEVGRVVVGMEAVTFQFLIALLGAANVLHGREDLILYEYDGSVEVAKPAYVVFPRSTEDVTC